jgi:hypothetical protein
VGDRLEGYVDLETAWRLQPFSQSLEYPPYFLDQWGRDKTIEVQLSSLVPLQPLFLTLENPIERGHQVAGFGIIGQVLKHQSD